MYYIIMSKKQLLNELYTYRLINFGNTAYQKISGDRQFQTIPISLWELWYSTEMVSFVSLGLNYRSDIELMSKSQLKKRIADEKYLLSLLRIEFADLENRK